jgi:methyl-accepting chemotaxis protein
VQSLFHPGLLFALWLGGLILGHIGLLRALLVAMRIRDPRSVGGSEQTLAPARAATAALHQQVVQQQVQCKTMAQHLAATQTLIATLEEQAQSLAAHADGGLVGLASVLEVHQAMQGHLSALGLRVKETGSSLEEMVFSSKEVASGIQDLSRASEETAASMNEMDVSISHVETNANETSKLSEKVSMDAELGVTAIKQTIAGINKIKDNGRLAADVIERLSQYILEVATILSVIDDVAEQTNLLALNAAIIAAQAGEHGRGFAVVADEIKALAERTGASTKEISDIILRVQEHSRQATDVMAQGVQHVEEGMRLGHHAEEALHNIVSSAQRSTVMMHAIAQATVEQAKGSKQVNKSVARIAETMAQIFYATSEQARGSDQIIEVTNGMHQLMDEVQKALARQSTMGSTLADTFRAVQHSTLQLQAAQVDELAQHKALTQTLQAVSADVEAMAPHCAVLGHALGMRQTDVAP